MAAGAFGEVAAFLRDVRGCRHSALGARGRRACRQRRRSLGRGRADRAPNTDSGPPRTVARRIADDLGDTGPLHIDRGRRDADRLAIRSDRSAP